jgi:hypothetical protein
MMFEGKTLVESVVGLIVGGRYWRMVRTYFMNRVLLKEVEVAGGVVRCI